MGADIQIPGPVKAFHRDILEVALDLRAGVVVQDVDAATWFMDTIASLGPTMLQATVSPPSATRTWPVT